MVLNGPENKLTWVRASHGDIEMYVCTRISLVDRVFRNKERPILPTYNFIYFCVNNVVYF